MVAKVTAFQKTSAIWQLTGCWCLLLLENTSAPLPGIKRWRTLQAAHVSESILCFSLHDTNSTRQTQVGNMLVSILTWGFSHIRSWCVTKNTNMMCACCFRWVIIWSLSTVGVLSLFGTSKAEVRVQGPAFLSVYVTFSLTHHPFLCLRHLLAAGI